MPDKITNRGIANGAVTTVQLSQAVNDRTNTIHTQANTAYAQANAAYNAANTKASIGLVIALS